MSLYLLFFIIASCAKENLTSESAATESQFSKTSATTTTTTSVAPVTGTRLLFKSGFESNMVLQGPLTGNGYQEKQLTGTDAATGYSWPIKAWGGYSYLQAMAYGGYKLAIDGSKPRTGSKSLYQQITNISTANYGDANQIPLIWSPTNTLTQQKDLYITGWYYLQPDLADKLVYTSGGGPQSNGLWGDWRMFWEYKTGGTGTNWGGDFRTKIEIMKNSSGKLYWKINADNNANGGYPRNSACWTSPVTNTTVPVPLGQWFKFEAFIHRSSGSDGRFWAKINGQTLIDRYQNNIGSHNDPINRMFLSTVYTHGKAPQYQWVDDIEIWGN